MQNADLSLDEDLGAIEKSVDRLIAALRDERARMAHLLKQIGASDHCNGCSASILWVRHRNGSATPYNMDGSPHFGSCPKASQFRRKEKRA
jgi:hypothetical protein